MNSNPVTAVCSMICSFLLFAILWVIAPGFAEFLTGLSIAALVISGIVLFYREAPGIIQGAMWLSAVVIALFLFIPLARYIIILAFVGFMVCGVIRMVFQRVGKGSVWIWN